MRFLLSIIAISTFFIFSSCKVAKKEKATTTKKTVHLQQPEVNIAKNQKITSPLYVEVHSKGFWLASEGELGTVTLVDSNNKTLASGILTSKDGNWMTSGDAIFTSTIPFSVNGKTSGKLIFKNRLVRKNDVEKTIEIPIQF